MAYQVLARKWRPRRFDDLVGQGHVVRALRNALDRGQLHHAYLFTGTRGVGKTTLARILAKALNCESGVGADPCGTCDTCREVDEGRFVDLLEVDAASRTKVDQTRELLDNVPFAPVRGRFKVYLIDEVHMFSASSFNALLKTLEEPPPHVKFVLATTDPQKLPATVLSRCLQFNLKRLLPEQVQQQFRIVLEAEGVGFDEPALAQLARAADGSMRDGLSLLDQAIAFGAGRVSVDDVRAMLGSYGADMALDLVAALGRGDGAEILQLIARLAELTPDFSGVLMALLDQLHRIALFQQVPTSLSAEDPDAEPIRELAAAISAEDVQLFYQVLLIGQQDLPLAPDPRTGLEMVLLRALAFRPVVGPGSGPGSGRAGSSRSTTAPPASEPPAAAAAGSVTGPDARPTVARAPVQGECREAVGPAAVAPTPRVQTPSAGASPSRPVGRAGGPMALAKAEQEAPLRLDAAEDWHRLVAEMGLEGLEGQLARHCAFANWDGNRLHLVLDPSAATMRVAGAEQRLGAALAAALCRPLSLQIDQSSPPAETPAERKRRLDAERRAAAEQSMMQDPVAAALRARFDAEWVPGSIRAIQ
jgi:DNA polymerase-3 subunit gamma/tau